MKKILIVEDDIELRNELAIFLNNNGFNSVCLENFSNTLNGILSINPELVLLDINLPGCDGEFICRELRKKSNVPIIIITSKDSELDELVSINNGADHFITKPFNIQILLAKINSLLNRSSFTNTDIIDAKDFILNVSKCTIESRGVCIELTKNEFRILRYLVLNRNKIVTREDIMNNLWDSDCFIGDSTLTVNMTRVRNKLESIGLKELLVTKRGIGYILKENSNEI